MTRDDSFLNTGMSSASFAKEQQVRERKRDDIKEKRRQLLPAGQLVREEFQKEIQKLIYGPYVDEDTMSDEQFRAERRGRRLAVSSLLAIQGRLEKLLRVPKEGSNE